MALVAIPWYESVWFTLVLLGTCVALFLSVVLGWPFAAFLTRGGRSIEFKRTAGSRLASWLAWISSLAILAWLCLGMLPDPADVTYGVPSLYDLLLRTSPIIVALVVGVFIFTVLSWRNNYWRFSARLHYTCVLLAGLSFVWFLYHWNLLQWWT